VSVSKQIKTLRSDVGHRNGERGRIVKWRRVHGTASEVPSKSSGGSGFKSSTPWRQGSASEKPNAVDMSGTWKQLSGSLLEFVLMIGCLGFAFAASLRASHHQTVHDEEIEAMNYELVEAEEDAERVKENWKRIENKLKEAASKANSNSEAMVSLKLVEEMINNHMFSVNNPLMEEKEAEEARKVSEDDSTSTRINQAAGPLRLIPYNPNQRIILF
jgi:hypothetical protein